MSSLGGRNESDITFLSTCLTYRKAVTGGESLAAGSASSPTIPEIRMDIDRQAKFNPRVGGAETYSRNTHGHNGVLVLFVKCPNASAAIKITLVAWNDNDTADQAVNGDLSDWYLVETRTTTAGRQMLVFNDLPALRYKVLVESAHVAPNTVTILERHTE